MIKKILVSGCFDMLHSGHVEFFRQAASFGDLYVALGSDQTIFDYKQRPTVNTEQERLFMVRSLKMVKEAFISRGSGLLDFEPELREIMPDALVVNADGDIPQKRALCKELGIQYVVLDRTPHHGLHPRTTTDLRRIDRMPYRIDLAGGWLDQPFVSEHHAGAVVTISIEATHDFNERSGMASSTRRHAKELWGNSLPVGDHEKIAKTLFCYDNPPGTKVISGSQDSIGIVFPGLAKAFYEGEYWPRHIEHCCSESLLHFVEESLYLVPLGPRGADFDVLSDTSFSAAKAKALADAAHDCWEAIGKQDREAFGVSLRAGFEAQVAMFPHMLSEVVEAAIKEYGPQALGYKLSGAGGGGYLVLVADRVIPGALRVQARRPLGSSAH